MCVSGGEGAGGSGFFIFGILGHGCFLWHQSLQFAGVMAAAEASSKSSTVIVAVDGFH